MKILRRKLLRMTITHMYFEETRTPTHIWLEAKLRDLTSQGLGIYVTHKGEKMSGLVLLKLNGLEGACKLLTQQRNLEGALEWVSVFEDESVAEKKADEYIGRSVDRDPDLWVVEIEDKEMKNPFTE